MAQQKPAFFSQSGSDDSPPPWNLSSALLTVLAAFIIMIAVSTIVGVLLGERVQSALVLIAWTFGNIAIIAFVIQSRRDPKDAPALRLTPAQMPLPLLVFLGAGVALALDLISLALTKQFLPVPELITVTPTDTLTGIFAIALMLAAQPIAEELVFRGVAFPALRTRLGALPGLLLSALGYGVYHYALYTPLYANAPEETALWYGLLLPTLHGLLFSVIRARTGSSRAAIVVHVGVGLFALIKVFVLIR
jgi:membrane protease YdiL (CAAX protease family)